MKKALSFILSAILAITPLTMTMASCEKEEKTTTAATTVDDTPKEPTPKEIYEAATKIFDEADNFEVTYEHKISLNEGKGIIGSFAIIWQNITENYDRGNVHCKMTQNQQTVEISHIDGVMYMVQDMTKAKATMTWDEFVRLFEYERPDVIEKLSDSAFEDVTVTKQGDMTVMEFKLSESEMRSMAGDLKEFLQLGAASNSAQFKKGTYTVRINEYGYIIDTRWDFEMTVVYEKKQYNCYAFAQSTIAYAYAKAKTPKDADSYIDITGQLEIPE